MSTHSLPALFVRGGTSNGLIIQRSHLPADSADWQPILSSAMGSPDQFGRQLNGMGSGVSSTSKVCIVSPSDRPDADIDYTFVQVGIRDGTLELDGNCGNLASAVGMVGVEMLGSRDPRRGEDEEVEVRIFNTNTQKRIVARVKVTDDGTYDPLGEYSIDGVPGTGSKITLAFLEPGGAKTGKMLPTGNAMDWVGLGDGDGVWASLVDVANPGVFVRAEDLGVPGDVQPGMLEKNKQLMARLEKIRQQGTRMMGLDPNVQSVPKIVLVSRPRTGAIEERINIVCRALSMQQPHKAVPLTLGLNLGAACKIPGTIPASTAVNVEGPKSVVIAHASGKVEVGSVFEESKVKSALLLRTARVLMKGDVYYTLKS